MRSCGLTSSPRDLGLRRRDSRWTLGLVQCRVCRSADRGHAACNLWQDADSRDQVEQSLRTAIVWRRGGGFACRVFRVSLLDALALPPANAGGRFPCRPANASSRSACSSRRDRAARRHGADVARAARDDAAARQRASLPGRRLSRLRLHRRCGRPMTSPPAGHADLPDRARGVPRRPSGGSFSMAKVGAAGAARVWLGYLRAPSCSCHAIMAAAHRAARRG